MHKSVGTLLDLEVGDLTGTAVPEGFRAIGDFDSLQGQAVYLTKDFGRIDEAVEELQIAAVPHRRAVRRREIAVAAGDVLTLPDDVHALETAIDGFNMARLFESRLAFADGDAGELEIAGGIQRPLAGEESIRDFHFSALRIEISFYRLFLGALQRCICYLDVVELGEEGEGRIYISQYNAT